MSLILEALRRSEAERRRAAPPTLLGESGPARPSRTAAWPMALIGLLLGVLLAAVVAWWWSLGRTAPVAAAPESAVPVAVDASPEAPIEPVPAAAYAPPMPAMTTPAPSPPPAPVVAAPPPGPAPDAPSPEPTPPVSGAAPPAPIEPATGAAAAADSGHGPRDGDLPWSAVAGEALPPLRVSMQVYADAPERRFAIIDGQRRREGDALPSGLTLLEIRRDGLRLGWQGRVLWVPR